MKILIALAVMLLTCGISGKLWISIFRLKAPFSRMAIHLGYAYLLCAFYAFYILTHHALSASVLTLAIPFITAGSSCFYHYLRGGAPFSPSTVKSGDNSQHWLAPTLVCLFVLLFTSWPYLLTGWNHYWQSGNYDIEDALNGRDAYIGGQIFSASFDKSAFMVDKSSYDLAKITGTLPSTAAETNSYKQWYAEGGFRLQYSSLAFWSTLLLCPHGSDAFLLQATLNLLLMALGIFYLCLDIFEFSRPTAAISSFLSVTCVFYLTTYYAGHEGSMMYGSLIPTLLYLILAHPRKFNAPRARWSAISLIIITILYTYPQALAIMTPSLLAYWLLSTDSFYPKALKFHRYLCRKPWRYICLGLLLLAAATAVSCLVWNYTAPYRLQQLEKYRSWGFTHDWLIIPLYLGLICSPMQGLPFAGALMSHASYMTLVLIAGAILIGLVACFIRAARDRRRTFLFVYLIFWLLEFPVFKYVIFDSYYLYKFYYTQQFVFVIGCVGYVCESRFRLLKLAGFVLIGINLVNAFKLSTAIYHQPFNQRPNDYLALLHLPAGVLRHSFVEIQGGYATAIRQTLKAHGIQTLDDARHADYFIVPNGHDADITGAQFIDTIFTSGTLAVKRPPAHNFLLARSANEPEVFPDDTTLDSTVFRWVSQGRQDNLGIYIVRPVSVDAMRGKYLRICLQRGPSASRGIPITVTTADNRILAQEHLEDGIRIIWLPADQVLTAQQPLIIHSGSMGQSLLPKDDRILLYRAFAIGWTDHPYDLTSLLLLNRTKSDIITPKSTAKKDSAHVTPQLWLGQGWNGYEKSDGVNFRWAGPSVGLVITGGDKDRVIDISMDVQTGPSHGPTPLDLDIYDAANTLVATCPGIIGRQNIAFRLPAPHNQTLTYTLRCSGPKISLPADPRILSYRVFSIHQNTEPPIDRTP